MSVQIIQGSFHQGNPKFVESAGKQCTCCSLVSIAFSNIKIEMLESKYGVLTVCSQTGLIFNRNKRDSTADGALLILKGICISVIWTKKHYFLFDSHSKNEKGESCPDGYSILIIRIS